MLKFHSRHGPPGERGQMCPWPNQMLFVGQPRRFVGRDYIAADLQAKTPARYPASKEPSEVQEGTQDAVELKRQCKEKHAIWAADEHTAAFCEVAFVKLEQGEDGEWFAAKPAAPVTAGKSGKKD